MQVQILRLTRTRTRKFPQVIQLELDYILDTKRNYLTAQFCPTYYT